MSERGIGSGIAKRFNDPALVYVFIFLLKDLTLDFIQFLIGLYKLTLYELNRCILLLVILGIHTTLVYNPSSFPYRSF